MTLSLDRIAILLLVLAEAAGGFALGRLGRPFDIGIFGSARLWIVAAFVFTVVLTRLRRPILRTPVLTVGVAIAVLHVLLLSSLWWSPRPPSDEIEILNIMMLAVAMPLAALVFSVNVENHRRWMLALLYLLGVAALPIALLGFSSVSAELSLKTVGSIRIARTAGLAAVAGLALAAISRSAAWLIPVPLWVLVMLASGNRASLLAFLAGSLPLLRGVKKIRALRGGAVIAVVTSLVLASIPLAADVVRFFFQRAIWESQGHIYLADRGILFRAAWHLFSTAPIVGHGLGGYAALAGIYYEYPHNLTLNFASELGLLGLVPYAMIMGLAFAWIFRSRSPAHLGVAGIFVYLFVAAQFSGSFGDAFLMWVAAVAVLARLGRLKRRVEADDYRRAVT